MQEGLRVPALGQSLAAHVVAGGLAGSLRLLVVA